MDPNLEIGTVTLTVADLDRSIDYYANAIGYRLLRRDGALASLGVPGRTLVTLHEIPGAKPAPESSPGLSHFAPQLPTRGDLARFIRHYAALGEYEVDLRDHSVAESCYTFDPDGHGVEVTTASPRDEWEWVGGKPAVVSTPVPAQTFLDEPGAEQPWTGLPDGSETGHVQLKVTDADMAASEAFYCDLLGFSAEARMGTFFLAVGVTEHRALLVFTNRFGHSDVEPAPDDSARLLSTELLLSGPDQLQALADRLTAADYAYELSADTLTVSDPSTNVLRFTTRRG